MSNLTRSRLSVSSPRRAIAATVLSASISVTMLGAAPAFAEDSDTQTALLDCVATHGLDVEDLVKAYAGGGLGNAKFAEVFAAMEACREHMVDVGKEAGAGDSAAKPDSMSDAKMLKLQERLLKRAEVVADKIMKSSDRAEKLSEKAEKVRARAEQSATDGRDNAERLADRADRVEKRADKVAMKLERLLAKAERIATRLAGLVPADVESAA